MIRLYYFSKNALIVKSLTKWINFVVNEIKTGFSLEQRELMDLFGVLFTFMPLIC